MTHRQVFETFKKQFPQIAADVKDYFPNGRNAIRVRRPNERDLIFTIKKDGLWSLETVDMFVERLRGRTTM